MSKKPAPKVRKTLRRGAGSPRSRLAALRSAAEKWLAEIARLEREAGLTSPERILAEGAVADLSRADEFLKAGQGVPFEYYLTRAEGRLALRGINELNVAGIVEDAKARRVARQGRKAGAERATQSRSAKAVERRQRILAEVRRLRASGHVSRRDLAGVASRNLNERIEKVREVIREDKDSGEV